MCPLAILLCLVATVPHIACYEPYRLGWEVGTPSGPIRGVVDNSTGTPVQAYLGIPYAEPPLKGLRFLRPVPVFNWKETLLATARRPACVQPQSSYPWASNIGEQDEDCLHLNIWAPMTAREGKKKAVLLFVHGGDFAVGSNNAVGGMYDGDVLAKYYDVIVVTLNYRVGVMGFATSGGDEAPGNLGMYDILTALKWVRRNIPFFGGDPKKMTVVGQGSGSVAVSLLCVSPLARGLFANAVLMSGSMAAMTENALDKNKRLSQKFAEAVDCADNDTTVESNPEEVFDCLRDVDAHRLASAVYVDSFDLRVPDSFLPQYGDDLLPTSSALDLYSGRIGGGVNLLVGNDYSEGSLRLATAFPEIFDLYSPVNPTIDKDTGAEMLRKTFKGFPDPEAVVKYYLDPLNETDSDKILREVNFAVGDHSVLCPTLYFAESFGESNASSVFQYLHAYRVQPSRHAPWVGIPFFSELQLVFGRPFRPSAFGEYTDRDRNMSRAMMEIWTHFAKHGSPPAAFDWPQYPGSEHNYIFPYFNVRYLLTQGPHLQNCDFFRQYFKCDLLKNLSDEDLEKAKDRVGSLEECEGLPESWPEANAAILNRTSIGTPMYFKEAHVIRYPYH